MAAIAQMNKLRITNPYTHSGWIANPAERGIKNIKGEIIVYHFSLICCTFVIGFRIIAISELTLLVKEMAFAISSCPRNVEISKGQRCSYNVERKDKVNAHAIGVGGLITTFGQFHGLGEDKGSSRRFYDADLESLMLIGSSFPAFDV